MIEIVKPHRVISRDVTNDDIVRVRTVAAEMQEHIKHTCIALAHPQVDDKDPLRFFVTQNREIIINPVITRHSGYTRDSKEGCMTFPGKEAITKQRWPKIDVSFQQIENGKLGPVQTVALKNLVGDMFQHEIDHLNGVYCYDEN